MKKVEIGPKEDEGFVTGWYEAHMRVINDKLYDFQRVWNDDGEVIAISAYCLTTREYVHDFDLWTCD